MVREAGVPLCVESGLNIWWANLTTLAGSCLSGQG